MDCVTSEARYSLSEEKLIRQSIEYKIMTVYVSISPQTIYVSGLEAHTDTTDTSVKVLDCDTIVQVLFVNDRNWLSVVSFCIGRLRRRRTFQPMSTVQPVPVNFRFGQVVLGLTATLRMFVLFLPSQVKDKALDTIYRSTPYSQRPRKEDLDLEWRTGTSGRLVLYDEDSTMRVDGDWKKLNTLAHYRVPDGALLTLIPKQVRSFLI